jgi:hypothetical protein
MCEEKDEKQYQEYLQQEKQVYLKYFASYNIFLQYIPGNQTGNMYHILLFTKEIDEYYQPD